jgi:toxin CcdB
MRRYDVFVNEDARTCRRVPYFVVLQSDLLSGLNTVVVAPLGPAKLVEDRPAATLMPSVSVDDVDYIVYLPELAAVPARLMRKRVTNLESSRDALTRGLDLLFSGI